MYHPPLYVQAFLTNRSILTNLSKFFKLRCKPHAVAAPGSVEVNQPRILRQHNSFMKGLMVKFYYIRG